MRDRALVRAILATALRYRGTISRLIARRLERPLPPNAHQLSHVLHVAAAQILFLDIPDSAAVDLAVTHAKSDPRTTRFSGLVNGVLRGIARDKADALPAELDTAGRRAGMVPRSAGRRLWRRQGAGDPGRASRRGAGRFHREVRPRALGAGIRRHRACRRARSASNGWPPAWPSCLALPRANGGFRMPPRACPQDCSGMSPANVSPTSAPHPAARRRSWCSAGADVTALDSSRNRLKRLDENLQRLALPATLVEGRCAEI